MDYWNECITDACVDAGVNATSDQIDAIAGSVQVAHENYGMAHGYDCIPSQVGLDNERLKRELREERSKITCSKCGGSGRIVVQGPIHSAESECSTCRGEGRHTP